MEGPQSRASEGSHQPQAIAVLIGQLTPGGSERQLYLFLKLCDRTRWDPVVYVSGALGFWEGPIRKLGIPVVLLRGSPFAKMWQLRTACIAQNAKCFFSWSSYTNGFGLALGGLGVRRIGSYRNALFADLPVRLRWLWSRLALTGVSVLICNSRETQAQIAARRGGGKHVVHIPNGVQVFAPEQVQAWRQHWRTRLGISEGAVLVLGVGRLAPQKNFARFIDVIARVSEGAPVEAVVAGADQGCLADLERHIARLDLQKTIRLIGKVPYAHELMCAADIFLLSSDYEGMPNVVLEGMAAGVPCVATRVNGVSDLIQQETTGFVCEFDVEDLAQHVALLAADADRRRAMGLRARAVIERGFEPEDSARKLWKLCE